MKKPAKPRNTAKHVIGVRVDAELKAQIEAAAECEQRSVSQWLALAAREALKKSRER